MQRFRAKKSAYGAGKNATNQELIYQHMSNHYRRILNAKKRVDTSPPYCYKQKRTGSGKSVSDLPSSRSNKEKQTVLSRNLSPVLTDRTVSTNSYKEPCCTFPYTFNRYHTGCFGEDINSEYHQKCIFDKILIDQITYDTKHGPAAYCDHNWTHDKCQNNDKKFKPQMPMKKNKTNLAKNTKCKVNVRGFETQGKRQFPVELQNESSQQVAVGCSSEVQSCKCRNFCICDSNDKNVDLKKSVIHQKEQSQTSSRDSAYNGGVSSLPESRSPTPDQKTKKECYCMIGDERFFCQRKQHNVKFYNKNGFSKTLKEPESHNSSRNETPRNSGSNFPMVNSLLPRCNADEESLRKMKEDAIYIKFVQDITAEILEKCLYTNKALKLVMKRHVRDNMRTLDKKRMLKEIDHLRIQLGIPEDTAFFELDSSVPEYFSDTSKPFPIISDSELVMPMNEDQNLQSDKEILLEVYNETDESGNENSTSTSSLCKKNESKACKLPKTVEDIDEKNLKKSCDSNSENEDELMSVTQMTKTVREKRKCRNVSKTPAPFERRKNSSDDSDSLSCTNKRSKIYNGKTQSSKCSSSNSGSCSSSSSIIEEKITEEVSEEISEKLDGSEKLTVEKSYLKPKKKEESSESSILHKKSRTVSFWNNKDVHIHQKKVVNVKVTTELSENSDGKRSKSPYSSYRRLRS